jgi:hypothetical protein
MSFNLYLSSVQFPSQDPANLEYIFNPPLVLDGNYSLALVGGKITNSVPNVSPALNNNTFRYSLDDGASWTTVTIPTGTYNTAFLNQHLQDVMFANGDYTTVPPSTDPVFAISFEASIALLRFRIVLKPNASIDLTIGNFYQLLGFATPQIFDGGVSGATFTAPNIALFTTRGEIYYIQTDVIDGGLSLGENRINGVLKAVESGGIGLPISLRDPSGDYAYFPVNLKRLNRLRVQVYDNFGALANFNGETTSFELRFKKEK